MIGTKCDFGRGFWKRNRLISGKEIDEFRGQNIPSNARTIDRTSSSPTRIISHKSTDLRLKSYRLSSSVYRIGMRFVRQLAVYEGETRQDHQRRATYHLTWAVEVSDCKRILEWFIPIENVSKEHEAALERVVEDAGQMGIEVQIYRVEE